ncbi:MAG: HAD hydrolase family protein [Deltaproteobacteria bacterium]|nr:HAD hydrolase family protein [Deltaproteobacteria bacterium]
MSILPNATDLEVRAKRVRALILDVDGVLTDGRVIYLSNGAEAKNFHVRDGLGVQLLLAARIRVGIISGRESEIVERRAKELGIDPVLQGVDDKVAGFEKVLTALDLPEADVAYIGDDLPDLPIFKRAGLALAVADAVPEVRAAAHAVLRTGGGQGAVREACELLLKSRGAWRV